MTGWSAFETPMLNTFPAGALAWHSALASIKKYQSLHVFILNSIILLILLTLIKLKLSMFMLFLIFE